jgi:acetylornithine deacetylase/succinyl-diaminopimelate desuccinylase-like protein
MTGGNDDTIFQRPVELLQKLIRFETVNPPGNERECIEYIEQLLIAAGIETRLLCKDSNRPNLLARLKGKGDASPLLLYGHVDVVPANPAEWTHPPFWGEVVDGCVWGRGALDMKGAVVMMLNAFIRAKTEKTQLPGDVLLCILSDEEAHGDFGARFLVENHDHVFKDVRYALGEVGGFTFFIGGKKFYFIEVSQKQKCGIRAVIKGTSGHGSSYQKGGTMAKLARFLARMDKNRLPVHITPAAELMLNALADALPFPNGWILHQLLKPGRTDRILKVLGKKGDVFEAILHNTANVTIVRAGDKINVIPDEVEVQMDVRLLPGFTPDDALRELRPIVGNEVELEVMVYDPVPAEPDMGFYNTLAGILKHADPEGIPVPILMTGSSDARFFSRLGIQTYGFVPMQLPEDIRFHRILHNVDERIPVDTLQFGADAIFRAMKSQRD